MEVRNHQQTITSLGAQSPSLTTLSLSERKNRQLGKLENATGRLDEKIRFRPLLVQTITTHKA